MESAFEGGFIIDSVVVPFIAAFPFTVLTVTHSDVTQLADSRERLVLRLLLLLLILLPLILKSCQVESLCCQIDDNVTIEINGEGIVPVCLYYDTLGSQLVSDIRYIRIIENGV